MITRSGYFAARIEQMSRQSGNVTGVERFWSKVNKTENGCWLWTASLNAFGYGNFARPGRRGGMALAHRFGWEMMIGPIPEGLEIDHLCKVRNCVNPEHMELVTHAENVRRGRRFQSEKTHCPKGHPYSEENTYWHQGHRGCRICRLDASHRYRLRQGISIPRSSNVAATSQLATGPSD